MVSLSTVKRSLPLLAAAAAALPGCIERPWQEPGGRPAVDRSTLSDVLIAAPPTEMIAVGAVFGNAVELLGYRLEPQQLVPGRATRLTLFWRCRAELDPWHVFVHLDDAQGSGERIHAEHDPAQGRYPTDAWRPGDIVADPAVFIPGGRPLNLFVGLYSQGESRLSISSPGRGRDDGQSRLYLGTLEPAR
jgi:hypothetical protein